MKKIILILFVFSIVPTSLWAQSNIQIIKGMNDLLKVTRSEDFKKWTDTGGRVHIQNVETKGLMSYSIDCEEYIHEIKQKFALLIQNSKYLPLK